MKLPAHQKYVIFQVSNKVSTADKHKNLPNVVQNVRQIIDKKINDSFKIL